MKSSVACVILGKSAEIKNKILIARRAQKGEMGGRWEFPGGKVEGNESDREAIAREMLEEFGESVLVGEPVGSAQFEHCGETSNLRAYEVFVSNDGLERPFKLTEHTEAKWAAFEDLPSDNFVDSDKKLFPAVKRYIEKNYAEK